MGCGGGGGGIIPIGDTGGGGITVGVTCGRTRCGGGDGNDE